MSAPQPIRIPEPVLTEEGKPDKGIQPSVEPLDASTIAGLNAGVGREAMESLAAAVAIQRKPLGVAQQALQEHYQELQARLNDSLSSQMTYVASQKSTLLAELEVKQNRLATERDTKSSLEDDLRRAEVEYCEYNANLKTLIYQVRQSQLEAANTEASKHEELVRGYTQSTLERFRAESELRSGFREVALDASVRDWERNASEYERRADELALEQGRIDEQAKMVETHLLALQRYGITRNVSGFLFWTGSIGVAAAATLLSEYIELHDTTESTFDLIVGNVRKFILPASGPTSLWSVLAGIMPIGVLVMTVVLVALLLTAAVERYLKNDGTKSRPSKKAQGLYGSVTSLFPQWLLPVNHALSFVRSAPFVS